MNACDAVRLERRADGVAWIIIDRPGVRNAMSSAMWSAFGACIGAVAADESVRALIVGGVQRAFVSGADIGEMTPGVGPSAGVAYEDSVEAVLRALEALTVVTIAAVSGACTGGGVVLAAACDLRYGSADARVGMPIARTLGNITSAANVARVADVIGTARALEWLVTARLSDSDAAERAGFFNAVLPDFTALSAHAQTVAAGVARNAPLTVRAAKELVRRLRAAGRHNVADRDLLELCYGSDDFREGARAFVEKRVPHFEGR